MKYATFLLACVLCTAHFAESRPGAPRLCGRYLADALASVCAGRGYNGHSSGESTGSARGFRSITEACCINRCSVRTLASYCVRTEDSIEESQELLLPASAHARIYERIVRKEPEIDKKKQETDRATDKRPLHMSFDEAIRNAPVIVTVSPEFARPAIYPGRA